MGLKDGIGSRLAKGSGRRLRRAGLGEELLHQILNVVYLTSSYRAASKVSRKI